MGASQTMGRQTTGDTENRPRSTNMASNQPPKNMEMEPSLPLQSPTAPDRAHRQVTSPLDKVEGPQLQKTLMIPSAPTDVSATLSDPSSNQASDEPQTKHDPLRPTKQSFFHPPLPYNVMAAYSVLAMDEFPSIVELHTQISKRLRGPPPQKRKPKAEEGTLRGRSRSRSEIRIRRDLSDGPDNT
jgi:hypothetical protein